MYGVLGVNGGEKNGYRACCGNLKEMDRLEALGGRIILSWILREAVRERVDGIYVVEG
jgi:hypothetical protein